jgi:hypothetical protein
VLGVQPRRHNPAERGVVAVSPPNPPEGVPCVHDAKYGVRRSTLGGCAVPRRADPHCALLSGSALPQVFVQMLPLTLDGGLVVTRIGTSDVALHRGRVLRRYPAGEEDAESECGRL